MTKVADNSVIFDVVARMDERLAPDVYQTVE